MKGIVFSEFIEMVEDQFSPEVADAIIEASELASGGAYTSVGTYDHAEMVQLVVHLSERTDLPAPALINAFGNYLFSRFVALYPQFFTGVETSFDFLASIEDHVHTEVRKLYTDAELPRFACERPDEQTLIMTYSSNRPFADLAAGLIDGCIAHYQETIKVSEEDLSEGERKHVRFTLVRG